MSIPRPDQIVAIYPSLLCQMDPSPSRMVTLIDPLVMLPFLMRCLNSYADPEYASTSPRSYEEGTSQSK